jgi:hypothetical protein
MGETEIVPIKRKKKKKNQIERQSLSLATHSMQNTCKTVINKHKNIKMKTKINKKGRQVPT